MHGRALGRGLLDLERDAPPRAPVAAAPDRAVDAPAQLVLDLVALVVDVAERHGVVAARRVVLGGLGLLVARRWRRRRRRRGRRRGRRGRRRGRRRGERRRLRGLVLLERPPRLLDDLDRRPRDEAVVRHRVLRRAVVAVAVARARRRRRLADGPPPRAAEAAAQQQRRHAPEAAAPLVVLQVLVHFWRATVARQRSTPVAVPRPLRPWPRVPGLAPISLQAELFFFVHGAGFFFADRVPRAAAQPSGRGGSGPGRAGRGAAPI